MATTSILTFSPNDTGTNLLSDAQYLAEVRGALADIRQIMGVNAPAKVAQTDPSGENEYGSEQPALNDRERAARITALLDGARTRRAGTFDKPQTDVAAT